CEAGDDSRPADAVPQDPPPARTRGAAPHHRPGASRHPSAAVPRAGGAARRADRLLRAPATPDAEALDGRGSPEAARGRPWRALSGRTWIPARCEACTYTMRVPLASAPGGGDSEAAYRSHGSAAPNSSIRFTWLSIEETSTSTWLERRSPISILTSRKDGSRSSTCSGAVRSISPPS